MFWSSFALLLCAIVLHHRTVSSSDQPGYKKAGDFIIGGMLPISKECGSNDLNIKGIAIAHAIHYALSKIDLEKADEVDKKAGLKDKYKHLNIGFDLHDACAPGQVERRVAYKFAQEVYSSKQKKGPNVVLSAFSKKSIKSIKLLSIEDIPMMAYAIDNARLNQDASISNEDIKLLASAYPEQASKMLAVADLVKKFSFNHIHVISSDDAHGRNGVKALNSQLGEDVKTVHEIYIRGRTDVRAAIKKVAENPLIRACVLHLSGGLDADVFAEAVRMNLTSNIFISTHDWREKESQLKEFKERVEGMLFVNVAESHFFTGKQGRSIYQEHLTGIKRPFKSEKWLEDYYISLGANKNSNGCYSSNSGQASICEEAQGTMIKHLKSENNLAVVVIDAVYAIAEALKKNNESILGGLLEVDFKNLETENKLKYSPTLELQSTEFDIYSVNANGKPSLVGQWVKDNKPALKIKDGIVFKNGSSKIPISACSQPCLMSEFRTYPTGEETGCWVCAICPNGTVSNHTNARGCHQCPFGRTAAPNKTMCIDYKVKHFTWYDTMGQFLIFLMVVGVVISLFSIGIMSQNSTSSVVRIGGFQLCSFYLIGCIVCFLAPIPLLMMPSVTTCSSFISIFGVALTIPLAVLISKSAIVSERYFDDDNILVKTSMGQHPRALVIAICILLQVVIVVAGSYLSPPQILHQDTDLWNVKYAECAHYLSYPFWISFGYNICLGVFINLLSCGAEKIEERLGELKNLLTTSLLFYLIVIINISIIYREINEGLAAAQCVLCFVFGMVFVLGFMIPKVYTILWGSGVQGNADEEQLLADGKATPTKITATRHSDGYKHHGIIQMRIEEGSDDGDDTTA